MVRGTSVDGLRPQPPRRVNGARVSGDRPASAGKAPTGLPIQTGVVMRHLSPNLDMLRRALRVKVCADCPRRPPGSECLDCDTPRACETHCPIFIHLPQIKAI